MASISSEHILVRKGKELFADSKMGKVHLVEDVSANDFLNDIINFPHAYVLACCMDRQTKAERAWMIPVQIRDILGSFDMPVLAALTADEYKEIFSKHSLHRFNEKMAVVFYDAVQHIQNEYNGDASLIWANNPSSAAVVYRFLQFNGVGIKIATMATNILARQFKVPFSDYYSIDVSPDVHVRRVMYRMGLVKENATNDEIIYKARELCPEFPGIIDYSLWDIGRTYCNAITPKCASCILSDECHKQGISNKEIAYENS